MEAYRFIEHLERVLDVDFRSKKEQDTENGLSSHFDTREKSSENHVTISSNSDSFSMIQETPNTATTNESPFTGLPAMDLIAEGLENVDAATLRQSIEPIWKSLESLDAVAMLNLKQTTQGAQVSDGYVHVMHIGIPLLSFTLSNSLLSLIHSVFCKPIHDEVTPIRHRKGTIVRYVHVSEVPDKYSVGIFIFPPNACIPLHDHPHMCVLSRVLYGDLERTSLDLMREQEDQQQDSSWFPRWENKSKQRRPHHGARRAYLNGLDHLQAPDVTALYPYEGQLHEFRAGPNGAAVLDVLLPPYDEDHDRDCTFYQIREDSPSSPSNETRPCWIVPTAQPEDFHCLSGRYNELGGDYFDSDDSAES